MREILFRGKRLDSGKWAIGSYYCQKKCYGDDCDRHFIITSSEALGYDQALEYAEVDPDTISQFANTFVHGARLFEDDIIQVTQGTYDVKVTRVCRIVFCLYDGTPGFCAVDSYGTKRGLCEMTSAKIIGNIHDNPEMLEVKPDE